MTVACPDPHQLEQLLLGHYTDDTAHELEQHVEHCHRCSRLLPTLPAEDALVRAMRSSSTSSLRPADQSTIEVLIPQLRRLHAKASSATNGTNCRHLPTDPVTAPAVPGYEILDALGRGGMGVVYRARHIPLQRLVALKMILVGANAGAEQRARFLGEARAVARLQHPNIVQIHEIGESQGLPYFSLEFLEGGSLAQKLAGTPQPSLVSAELVETLARAVAYSHQRGIVHRDLKPANVLLDTRGPQPVGFGSPKITDFGLAKQETDSGQTRSGAILGTPSYMAPEQAKGQLKEVGPAADIYALGAILYEMLTGRPPFKGETPFDTVLQVASTDPVPPRRLQPKVPRDLELICLKCLRKEPAKRYTSAGQLAEELRRFQTGEPLLHTRPVTAAERAWRWCARNPARAAAYGLAAAMLVAVLCLAVGSVVAVRESQNATEQKRLAEALRRKQGETEAALKLATHEKERADRLRGLLALDHGLTVCESGDVGAGMLWLAQGLKQTTDPGDDLDRVFRLNLAACRAGIHPLQRHQELPKPVMAVAFSPDGRTFATACQDKTVQLWDTATGQFVGSPLPHEGWVHAVAFHPQGRTLLTASGDHKARIWDVETGKLLREFPHSDKVVWAAVFGPGGQTVLTGTGKREDIDAGKGEAQLWNAATGQPIKSFSHPGSVLAVAFAHHGRTILTGCGDKTARLWDTATGQPRGQPLRHSARVQAVGFHPDGRRFLTGCGDGLITHPQSAYLWDMTALGKPVQSFRHQGNVNCVAFSPDGQTILTGSADRTAQLWGLTTGQPRGSALKHQGWVQAAVFSPDGKRALTGSADSAVRLWQISELTNRAFHHENGQGVWSVALSPNGRNMVTGSADGTLRLWDTVSGKPTKSWTGHAGGVLAVAFSPDGRFILSGGRDATAGLWDASTGQPHGMPLLHDGQVTSVAFAPDGQRFVTGNAGKTARLWNTATGAPIGAPLPHGSYVTAVAFRPDGKTIATAGWDKVLLWNIQTGEPHGKPFAVQGWVQAVAFSPDGQTLATGSSDRTVRLWDPATGKPHRPPLLHPGSINTVAFNSDGRFLLSGGADHTARLWDVRTGKPVGMPLQHQGEVRSAVFSSDGKRILTGAEDRTAHLWTLPVPVKGSPEQLLCWSEVMIGQELGQDGIVRGLSAKKLDELRKRLDRLKSKAK